MALIVAGALLVGALALVVVLLGAPQSAGPPSGSQPVPPSTSVITSPPAPSPSGAGPSPTAAPEPKATPIPAALLGRDVEVIPEAGPVVALTFDAGANADGLPRILQALADAGVPATFFVTGSWAAANPPGVAAIVSGGHRVGNHSLTHPSFTDLTEPGIEEQVRGGQQAILAAGADPRPLFRFPFGDRDARTIAAVNNLGYVAVRWSVDTLGWKGTIGGSSAQQVVDRVLSGLQPGQIVLMHVGSNPDDGTTLDADALRQVTDRIRQAGYGFVTLDKLLAG